MSQRRPSHRRNPSVEVPKYQPMSPSKDAQPVVDRQRALAQISDYESENAGYASDLPAMQPPPAARTMEELNFAAIQRHHPEVVQILSVAPYAVIYEFEPIPEPSWEKKDIEGSLFICQLTPGPYNEERYAAIVLNRRGLKNFYAPLIEDESGGVEVTDQYVIISFKESHKQMIYGVFIFSEGPGTSTENTRAVNGDLMAALAGSAGLSRQAAEAAAAEAEARHANGHLHDAEQSLANHGVSEPMKRQISLQQFFGQQRTEDASYSGRTHTIDGERDLPPPQSLPASLPQAPSQQQQANVLMDLFRGVSSPQHAPQLAQPVQQPQRPQPPNGFGEALHTSTTPHQPQLSQQQNILANLFRGPAPPQQQQPPQQQADVLGDLFRRAGLGAS